MCVENKSSFKSDMEKVEKLVEKAVSLDEQNDRTRRKRNLIFYKIPESTSLDNIERFKHDCQTLKVIFKRKGLTIQSEWLGKVFRLGKKKEENDEPRPLLVQFDTIETRKRVMGHCHELKVLKDNVSVAIHHSLDLTPIQRVERKKLVNELKLRQSNGEKNISIIQGQIVEKTFPERARQFGWANIIKEVFSDSRE